MPVLILWPLKNQVKQTLCPQVTLKPGGSSSLGPFPKNVYSSFLELEGVEAVGIWPSFVNL